MCTGSPDCMLMCTSVVVLRPRREVQECISMLVGQVVTERPEEPFEWLDDWLAEAAEREEMAGPYCLHMVYRCAPKHSAQCLGPSVEYWRA